MPLDTAKIVCIYLAVWAVRHKWELDYKLNGRAQLLRWLIVAICYTLISLPGVKLAPIRVVAGFTGLAFLCWPNFAYHLSKPFQNWPMTEATVESSRESSTSRWSITYYFKLGDQTYGGTCTVKPIPGVGLKQAFPEGKRVAIRYDPLNPESSRVERTPGSLTY